MSFFIVVGCFVLVLGVVLIVSIPDLCTLTYFALGRITILSEGSIFASGCFVFVFV